MLELNKLATKLIPLQIAGDGTPSIQVITGMTIL